MAKRFLKIAFRFLWRNKTYSILNFLCLTFGLASAIIAVLYILNIFSFDKFHKNYEGLYEVEAMVTYFNGDRFLKEPLSASLKEVLKVNVPEIESFTRIADRSYSLVAGDKSFTENGIYADEEFFSMFSFPFVTADDPTVLSDINSIVISERLANKLFETTDCLGKVLTLKDDQKEEAFKISGVLMNVPSQSLLQFDFVIPFSKFLADNSWANETGVSANQIWGLFKKNTNVSKVNARIKDLIKNQETTLNQELFLFPLKEKILYSYAGEKRVWKEMQNVVIIGSIGFAILIIACFNFINLAIALNIRRYREVGIKKVAGATKSVIVIQFLGETFILILTSMFIAIVLVRLLLVGFNTMFDSDIHLRFTEFKVILAFTLIAIFTGLFSGLLPSLYLSSSNPVSILKARIITSQSYSILRQSLIVCQFVIPVVLIICMMIIKVQDKYMRNFDLGFEKDKLIIINNTKNLDGHEESLKNDLLTIPGIETASFTNCIPTRGARVSNEVTCEGKDNIEKLHFWCVNADFNYNKAVRIKMATGRYFDKSFLSDSTSYVINDVAANIMKSKDPVGKSLTVDGKRGTIIGVFEDFHAIDLAGPLVPTIISLNSENRSNLLISFSSGSYPEIIQKVNEIYKRYERDIPFHPVLFGDLPDYSRLSTTSNLVGLAFFIALLLACLGLSGLASFTAERRTKEIGIRKVNGATIVSIMRLLLKNYSKWLIISFLIAIPVAFLLGKIFLSRFYFHTPMPLWTFIAGPCIAYVVSLLTVSWQSWRAATRNPVETLSCE
jgi:ABC-type antimicrobial peptide transport system permease subunit